METTSYPKEHEANDREDVHEDKREHGSEKNRFAIASNTLNDILQGGIVQHNVKEQKAVPERPVAARNVRQRVMHQSKQADKQKCKTVIEAGISDKLHHTRG